METKRRLDMPNGGRGMAAWLPGYGWRVNRVAGDGRQVNGEAAAAEGLIEGGSGWGPCALGAWDWKTEATHCLAGLPARLGLPAGHARPATWQGGTLSRRRGSTHSGAASGGGDALEKNWGVAAGLAANGALHTLGDAGGSRNSAHGGGAGGGSDALQASRGGAAGGAAHGAGFILGHAGGRRDGAHGGGTGGGGDALQASRGGAAGRAAHGAGLILGNTGGGRRGIAAHAQQAEGEAQGGLG